MTLDFNKLSWKLLSSGDSSLIYKAIHNGHIFIKKQYRKQIINNSSRIKEDMFITEIQCLQLLKNYKYFPLLLDYDKKDLIIYMTYSGKIIHKFNKPKNYISQCDEIIKIIKQNKICYRDMKQHNITILNGRIYLIDFGMCFIDKNMHLCDIDKLYETIENAQY